MLEIDKQNIIQQSSDIKDILDLPQGRRFLWRVVSYCGVYRALEGDNIEMMKQEGHRQIGLYLLGILADVDDELVFKMMREAKNKDLEDNYVRKTENDANERRDSRDDFDRIDSHNYTGNILSDFI